MTSNLGDKACGYYRYCLDKFSDYRCYVHDINSVDFKMIQKNDVVIIGGGGLLNALNEWNYSINKATKAAGKSIIWSAGFNSSTKKNICCKINWDRFDLVSIRDYSHPSGMQYLPCATCLMHQLDSQYSLTRKIGVVIHENKRQIPSELMNYDIIDNGCDIDDFVSFIGQSEIVVTNSYHAIYWATLMGKKVVLFGPTSEKFNYLKYKPVCYSGNIISDIELENECACKEALKESRSLTNNYLEEILSVIRGN